MRLWKAHGLGNDYLVWEGDADVLSAENVKKICHRNKGFGSDGILEPIHSEVGDFGVRIWNPDGSIAEKSGNGLRIFSWWLSKKQMRGHSFRIDTTFDQVEARVFEKSVQIDMGTPVFDYQKIPTTRELWAEHFWLDERVKLYTVSMGNPHCVVFFDREIDLDGLEWRKWGRDLECHPLFPNRSNIQFAQIIDAHNIRLRIWERGAGETDASGSSSCAVFAVAHRLGIVEDMVQAHMPGGVLDLSMKEKHIYMRGPVSEIGYLELTPSFLSQPHRS